MALAPGARIGPYEVIAQLGEGGMGEVYRAADTHLKRQVALKVLPAAAAADPSHLLRLQREATLLAALNHPNIAQVHGLEHANGTLAIVMELVEGPTLAEVIARGALTMDEAWTVATQIARGLDAAHQHGIVHRDLKPANIKIRPDRTVKVLDFGLAKAMTSAPATSGGVTDASTATPAMTTSTGVILGTPAYMSPEQARGLPADRRSDIWSFGCVVYEMLTGERLFGGRTVTDTLAMVLTREPHWPRVPARARRLLRYCLERDPDRRLRDIGDAILLLDEPVAPSIERRASTLPWAVAAAALAALAFTLLLLWPAPDDRQLVRLPVDLGDVADDVLVPAAISADGARLVFYARDDEGRRILATRRLDEPAPTLLTGTAGADQPFLSSDGEWIGFFSGDGLHKVPVQGGTPIRLANARTPRGAAWGEDGTIVAALTNQSGLSLIAPAGGEPRSLTTLSPGEPTHRWPQILPGGAAVIFTANAPSLNSYEDATIDVVSLATNERKTVWRGGYFGRYLPTGGDSGHLVYMRGGALFAVPFDPDRLELLGTPTRLLDTVAADPGSGAGRFDVSRTGTFVYRSGAAVRPWTVTWVSAAGEPRPLLTKPAQYYSPRVSPDGQRVAFVIDSGNGGDIYVYDWRRDVQLPLTHGGLAGADPVWAPDGAHLLFRTYANTRALWWVRADGGGEPVKLLDIDASNLGPHSLTPDGRTVVFSAIGGDGNSDMWTVSLDLADADRPTVAAPRPFFHSPAVEARPAVSRDGRWVSYESTESGTVEIYVRAFQGPTSGGGKWQVSSGGGTQPVWSKQGGQLFFLSANRIMVTDYTDSNGTFAAGKPRVWSPLPGLAGGAFSVYDVHPDGTRVAFLSRQPSDARDQPPRMTLLFNFFDDVRRRAPRP